MSAKRLTFLASVALSAAAAAQQATPAPLTRADTDRIIAVRVGQTLDIRLRQAAGTGSRWRMVPAKGLMLVSGPTVTAVTPAGAPGGPPIVGGPQTVAFRVRVTMGGELALTFVNAATFGGPDQKAETATFIIEGS